MRRNVLAGCAVLLAVLFPVAELAAGKGTAGKLSHSPKAQTPAPVAGETPVTDTHRDVVVDQLGATFGGIGQAFRHAASSGAVLFHRPPGWSQGNKTGWSGGAVPPGLAKKSRLPSARPGVTVITAEINRREVANFDRFLDSHPALDKSLSQNPSLINSQAFLASNPSLAAWLKAHPQAAEELKENPRGFVRVEQQFDRREAETGDEGRLPLSDATPVKVARFDRFLDANPSVAASLSKNPSLINNATFLAQNPSLTVWLKTHPQAATELKENPQTFMSLEQSFETTRPDVLDGLL